MKYLKFISPIPLLLFIVALLFPFVEHTTRWRGTTITVEYGYDFGMVFLPLSLMIAILLVVNIWRTRFVAIVCFVLCFGILFSLFLLQFQMMPVSSYTTHEIQFGYTLALLSVPLLMVILLVNLVKTFLRVKRNSQSET